MKLKQPVYEIENLSLDSNNLNVNETVFHNANGYIGIRSNFEEGYPEDVDTIRGTYINGFYDIAEMKQAESLYGLVEDKQTMLNVVDTQTINLSLDGENFSLFEGTTIKSRRWLDMENGVTGRNIIWRSPSGKEVEITIKRMASFCQLSLFTIDYAVKALNFSGKVDFLSFHLGEVENYSNENDPRVAKERNKYLIPTDAIINSGASYLTSHTSKSDLSLCTGVSHRLSKVGSIEVNIDGHSAISKIETFINEKETITLTKYTVFSDSIRHDNCLANAKAEMTKALSVPLERLYEVQKNYLNEYWENCLEIKGDDELTEAVNYNMYQLIQSVGKDEYCNITAKGLSGEGYEGHYFWDTEMYIEPFFNLTKPEITKNLISFRYNTLGPARKNAKILGHTKGALFPWRTIMGTECSGYFPSGTAGYHINGDIAFSVISYYLATKDLDFIAEKGAEIIFETARLWIDVGNYSNGTFRINEVTGPDEYTCMVNNNYYTNVSAQYNLRWASKFYYMLKAKGQERVVDKLGISENEIKEFEHAAQAMYLPYDEKLKINPQDDSFLDKKRWDLENTPKKNFPLLLHYHPLHLYRHQVCKQADTVLAHFIFEDAQSMETIRNSFHYYEKVTTHDSSLSTCIFSIMASKLGLTDKAYEYFGDSAKLDLFNTHKNTRDGIHTANMGGNFMAIVYGFAGLRIKESGIYFAPAIPKQWEEYKFQITYEDCQIKVEVNQYDNIFTLVKGNSKLIHVYGMDYELKDILTVPHNQNYYLINTYDYWKGDGYMKYKAIIFDLDGVICHTDHYHYIAWKQLADKLGVFFDNTINNRLRGVSRMESLEIILQKYTGTPFTYEQKVQLTEEKNAIYKQMLSKMSTADLDPEVKETLDSIRAKGLKLAIGSSSKNTKLILKQIGLDNYFDAISDGTNISHSKPHPEVFLKAAEFLNMAPEECMVVEDAKAGIDAAVAAKMDSAAIGDASGYPLATYELPSFSSLKGILY